MKNKKESKKRGVKQRKWVYFFEKRIKLNCKEFWHLVSLQSIGISVIYEYVNKLISKLLLLRLYIYNVNFSVI